MLGAEPPARQRCDEPSALGSTWPKQAPVVCWHWCGMVWGAVLPFSTELKFCGCAGCGSSRPPTEGTEGFKTKMSCCTSLFSFSIAGIQCMKLSGYSKGYGYTIGQVFKGDSSHAWNAVYLEGRWHLLDSTWGSGTVDKTSDKFTFR